MNHIDVPAVTPVKITRPERVSVRNLRLVKRLNVLSGSTRSVTSSYAVAAAMIVDHTLSEVRMLRKTFMLPPFHYTHPADSCQ